MDNSLTVFFVQAVIALFSFFVVAPCILNCVSTFAVQNRFAKVMVEEGVITEEKRKLLQPKKMIAGVIISLVVLAALAGIAIKTAPMGYLCGGIALAAGFVKFRKVLEFNSLTAKRFSNTYKHVMDTQKYDKYIDKMF